MTFAQYRRLKPKYQIRIVIAGIIMIGLFVLLLLGISALYNFALAQFNTKTLEDITSVNFLSQSTFSRVLEITGENKQEQDPEQIYVLDSHIQCNNEGGVEAAEIHMISLPQKNRADHWTLRLKNNKTVLQLTDSENRNRANLQYSKLTFAKYYPTLQLIQSPTWLKKLQETYPAGEGGQYFFNDTFENTLDPPFAKELEKGYDGFKVASTGNGVSPLPKTTAITSGSSVPFLLSVQAVDTKKSKGERVVLQNEDIVAVVLFDVTEYRIG